MFSATTDVAEYERGFCSFGNGSLRRRRYGSGASTKTAALDGAPDLLPRIGSRPRLTLAGTMLGELPGDLDALMSVRRRFSL